MDACIHFQYTRLQKGFLMKTDRLVSIILILLEKQRISARQLAEMFEVSIRTIYRDIDAINMAGIPVCATPGAGGGFEIMPQYKIGQKVFSKNDLSALLLGLTSLSGVLSNRELANTSAKIRSILPKEQAGDIELMASQISIDLSPWTGNCNVQSCLDILKTAIQEKRLVSFDYVAHHGSRSSRTVEPCQLILKDSHWYFHGYCHTREAFRLFRLSRISGLTLKEETFAPRDYQKPQLDFSVFPDHLLKKIKLRIQKSILDQVLDFCSYEDILPDGSDHYLVLFPFIENDYFYNLLLGFGDKCECLEPPSVRTELIRRIHNMAANYKMFP